MSLAQARRSPKVPVAGTLAAWLSGLQASDVPDGALDAAGDAILDVAGVIYAGLDMPLAAYARREAVVESREGPATVFGADVRLAGPVAARVNAIAAHVLDFDANFNRGMVFGPAVLFPSLLALAEEQGADGRTVLSAFAIGTEVARVLAESLSSRPYRKDRDGLFYRGWFNTGVLGPVAVAAAAGWMTGLDEERLRNALAIAVVQASGLRIGVGSDMKPLLTGRACETGMRAALSARAGFGAPAEVFEGARGFVEVVNGGAWTEAAFEELGAFTDAGPSFKLFPACSSIQAAAEALLGLLTDEGANGDDVEAVRCEVTPHVVRNLAFPDPVNATQAQFSMPYALGCILAHGGFSARHLTQEALRDPAIRCEMAKVAMSDTLHFADDDAARDFAEASRVTVRLRGGRTIARRVDAASGKPANPLGAPERHDKFLRNVSPALGREDAGRLLDLLSRLGEAADVRTIFAKRSGAR